MGNIPLWLCIPFAGLLLCIAIFPLVKGEWWDKNKGWAVLIWSLLFIIPFAVKYGAGETAETVLECIVNDYLSFIVLLFGLFCVSGNINLEGDFVGSPRMNTGLLAIGTLLSSCIGTTGASMLLVRPMIQMNSWRRNKSHIMVFFIFLISNMGGCLTPIGDPPLLMGFMRGVPFTWSLRLFPVLIFNMVILLTVFYFIDRRAYRRDIALGMRPDISRPTTTLKVNGLHNIIFMIMIVAGVVLSGVLPGMKAFQNADGSVISVPIFRIRGSYQEPFYLGCHRGSCSIVYRYLYHHAAGTDDFKEQGSRTGADETIRDVLGDRCTFQLSGQYTNLSGIPYHRRYTWCHDRCCNDRGNRCCQNADGDFLWCSIYGSQHLYRKCTELYGEIHLG